MEMILILGGFFVVSIIIGIYRDGKGDLQSGFVSAYEVVAEMDDPQSVMTWIQNIKVRASALRLLGEKVKALQFEGAVIAGIARLGELTNDPSIRPDLYSRIKLAHRDWVVSDTHMVESLLRRRGLSTDHLQHIAARGTMEDLGVTGLSDLTP